MTHAVADAQELAGSSLAHAAAAVTGRRQGFLIEDDSSSEAAIAVDVGSSASDGSPSSMSSSSSSSSSAEDGKKNKKKKKSKKAKKEEIRVKNDPESMQKVEAQIKKLCSDLHSAKIDIDNALKNEKNEHFESIKKKIGHAPPVINAAMEKYEGMMRDKDSTLYCDLKKIKTDIKAEVEVVNSFLTAINCLR